MSNDREPVGAQEVDPTCPNQACGHGDEAHTLSGYCLELDCPCGESPTLDARTRDALAGRGWEMSLEERGRRGLWCGSDE